MDRTERDAATPVLRKNEPHESTWRDNARGSWNPHDVWLTRIRQPRELAARLTASASAIPSSSKIPG